MTPDDPNNTHTPGEAVIVGQGLGALILENPPAQDVAEHEPVAVRGNFDGFGWQYLDSGSGSDWLTRWPDAEPLYAALAQNTHPASFYMWDASEEIQTAGYWSQDPPTGGGNPSTRLVTVLPEVVPVTSKPGTFDMGTLHGAVEIGGKRYVPVEVYHDLLDRAGKMDSELRRLRGQDVAGLIERLEKWGDGEALASHFIGAKSAKQDCAEAAVALRAIKEKMDE